MRLRCRRVPPAEITYVGYKKNHMSMFAEFLDSFIQSMPFIRVGDNDAPVASFWPGPMYIKIISPVVEAYA